MARADIKKLSDELINSRLAFVARGDQELERVYSQVKAQYPDLCDDSYLCADNCSSGHRQPEWRHAVRRVLTRLKAQGTVTAGGKRKVWRFV